MADDFAAAAMDLAAKGDVAFALHAAVLSSFGMPGANGLGFAFATDDSCDPAPPWCVRSGVECTEPSVHCMAAAFGDRLPEVRSR